MYTLEIPEKKSPGLIRQENNPKFIIILDCTQFYKNDQNVILSGLVRSEFRLVSKNLVWSNKKI